MYLCKVWGVKANAKSRAKSTAMAGPTPLAPVAFPTVVADNTGPAILEASRAFENAYIRSHVQILICLYPLPKQWTDNIEKSV